MNEWIIKIKDEARNVLQYSTTRHDDIMMLLSQEDKDEDRDSSLDSSDCALLASKLSQNYRNNVTTTTATSSSSSLTDFLSSHGILLTMCFPLGSINCILPFGVNHIASSYINIETGVRVIPSWPPIPTNPQIGLILDPTRLKINCLYPTDGASDVRDNKGCGPMMNDSKYGSAFKNFWNRYYTKQAILNHKNLNFGPATDWIDIDCNDFFVIPKQNQDPQNQLYVHHSIMWDFLNDNNPNNPNPQQQQQQQQIWIAWDFITTTEENANTAEIIAKSDNNNTIYYKSGISWYADNFADVMGHPVCSIINEEEEEKSTTTTLVSSSIIPTTTTSNGIVGGLNNDDDSSTSFLLAASSPSTSSRRALLRGGSKNNVSIRNSNKNKSKNKPPCPTTQDDDGKSFCFPLFAGHQSWPPTIDGFKDIMNIMLHSQLIDDFSNLTTYNYWNEFVIDLPTTTVSDIVMGVFYLDTGPTMKNRNETIDAAKLEAKRLSLSKTKNKNSKKMSTTIIPVFKMDIENSKSKSNDLLSCVE